MRKWDTLAAGLGLLIGLALLLYWLSPRVTGWSPDSAEVGRRQAIRVSLNRAIDPESLAGRFRLSPDLPGQVTVDGADIVFQPLEPFAYGTAYTARLASGVRASDGLPLWVGSEFTFTVADPSLLYLKEEDGRVDLWRQDPAGEKRRLTDEPLGIWDYSVIPGGAGLVISPLKADETTDLVQLTALGERRPLLECPDSRCSSAFWQPAGQWIAFERQALGTNFDETEVWLLDTASGEVSPAHDPAWLAEAGFTSRTSRAPRWSHDGRYLAYYKPDARVIVIRDMAGDEPVLVAANMELMGGWSPVDYRLAYTELAFGEQDPHEHVDEDGTVIEHTRPALYDHLVITDLASRETVDFSQNLEVNEGQPAWHPDGQRLAIGRTETGSGRQIWLIPADGRAGQALTDDPFVDHASLSWSPDGAKLAFMRVGVGVAGGNPAVWLLVPVQGQELMIEEGAFWPGWLE